MGALSPQALRTNCPETCHAMPASLPCTYVPSPCHMPASLPCTCALWPCHAHSSTTHQRPSLTRRAHITPNHGPPPATPCEDVAGREGLAHSNPTPELPAMLGLPAVIRLHRSTLVPSPGEKVDEPRAAPICSPYPACPSCTPYAPPLDAAPGWMGRRSRSCPSPPRCCRSPAQSAQSSPRL